MTLSVGECVSGAEAADASGSPAILPSATAWEAIERMEQAKTDRLRVDGGGVVLRRQIFDTLGAS